MGRLILCSATFCLGRYNGAGQGKIVLTVVFRFELNSPTVLSNFFMFD